MTAEQRAELLKHVKKDNLSEKISYRDSEKIAKDLNLSMEQVSLFQVVDLVLLFISLGKENPIRCNSPAPFYIFLNMFVALTWFSQNNVIFHLSKKA